MNSYARQNGIVLIVVLLVSVIALGAIVAATSVAALSSRQVSRFESAATVALMAAESGHNTLLRRAGLYEFDQDLHDSIGDWLEASWAGGFSFSDYELPGGARVQLSAIGDASTGVITIRSVGVAPDGSARRVLLQDYEVEFGTVLVTQYSDAALVTKTVLQSRSAPSQLRGLSERYGDWIFEGHLTSARTGEYALFGGIKSGYTVEGGITYRVNVLVEDDRGRPLEIELTRVPVPDAEDDELEAYPETVNCTFDSQRSFVSGDDLCLEPALLIPFAVAEESTLVIDESGTIRLPVNESTVEAFNVGDTVHFGEDAPDAFIAEIVGMGEDYLEFSSTNSHLLSQTVHEGTPIRGGVLSAIAEGGCDVDEARDTPQGCDDTTELGDLWVNTFGTISKTTMRAVAMAETEAELRALRASPEYGLTDAQVEHWLGVERAHYGDGAWPTTVEGLTWIDGAETRGMNNRLCGSGIVVINTGVDLEDDTDTINLTTQDCEFRGVLYVLGQLKLVGNLSHFQGVVYVEGPGGITEMQGTGRGGMPGMDDNPKSLYNAIAVRDAFGLLPADEVVDGIFGALDRSLRLGTFGGP